MKRRRTALPVLASLALASAAAAALAQVAPPKELLGSYAPKGDCAVEPRVVLEATAMTIQVGGRSTRLSPIDACYSCAGGAQYQGIEVWVAQLGPNGEPKEPFLRFNADEKTDVVMVDRQGAQSYPPALRAVALASPLNRCRK